MLRGSPRPFFLKRLSLFCFHCNRDRKGRPTGASLKQSTAAGRPYAQPWQVCSSRIRSVAMTATFATALWGTQCRYGGGGVTELQWTLGVGQKTTWVSKYRSGKANQPQKQGEREERKEGRAHGFILGNTSFSSQPHRQPPGPPAPSVRFQ